MSVLGWKVRSLVRARTYTAVSVLTLALGIGGTVAVFGVMDAVLLRPLPYEDPAGLMQITQGLGGETSRGMAGIDIMLLKERVDALSEVAWFVEPQSMPMTGTGAPEVVRVRETSVNFFGILGREPFLGRGFRAGEDVEGRADVVVLSHGFWLRRFGGDSGVVGQSLTINGRPRTVVGVLPPSFRFDLDGGQDLFLPRVFDPSSGNYTGWFRDAVVARLAAGVSLEAAGAELAAWAVAMEEEFPTRRTDVPVSIRPLKDLFVGDVAGVIWSLFAAVGLVLVVAVANLAHLALARLSSQVPELALRSALGAGRRRIVFEQTVEAGVLAVAGALLGVALAAVALPAILALSPADVPGLAGAGLDGRTLGFAALLGVGVTLFLGVVPPLLVLPGARAHVARARASTSGRTGARSLLMAGETALVTALLLVAALLYDSLRNTRAVDPGFDTSDGVAVQLTVPTRRYPGVAEIQGFYQRVVENLRALPGVTAVGGASTLPLSGEGITIPAPVAEGEVRSGPAVASQVRTGWDAVTPGYFEALGMPLLAGRLFGPVDAQDSVRVIAVNQTFARAVFGEGEPAVGRRVVFGTNQTSTMEVVAVVGDVRHDGLREPPRPAFYQYAPESTFPWPTFEIVVRGDRAFLPSERTIREAVQQVDPDQPVSLVRPLSSVWAESMAEARFQVVLLGMFAGVALLLGVVGIYGVISHATALRRREMGVRLALGAEGARVTATVLGQALARVGIGVVVGLAGGMGLAHVLRAFLFGVSPTDPGAAALIAAVLLATGALAAYLPARRAGRTDPVEALRAS